MPGEACHVPAICAHCWTNGDSTPVLTRRVPMHQVCSVILFSHTRRRDVQRRPPPRGQSIPRSPARHGRRLQRRAAAAAAQECGEPAVCHLGRRALPHTDGVPQELQQQWRQVWVCLGGHRQQQRGWWRWRWRWRPQAGDTRWNGFIHAAWNIGRSASAFICFIHTPWKGTAQLRAATYLP